MPDLSTVSTSWAHQWSWPTICTCFSDSSTVINLFNIQWQNYTSLCSSTSSALPLVHHSHHWAAASLKALLDCATAHPVTKKLGASESSLTHLISSQMCRFSLVVFLALSPPLHFPSHRHPPSQSILIMWQFLYINLFLVPHCLAVAGTLLTPFHTQYCSPVVPWGLPALLPPSFPLSLPLSRSFFLFYTTVGINFKIVLQEYTQCIRRYGPSRISLCYSALHTPFMWFETCPTFLLASGTCPRSSRFPHPQ